MTREESREAILQRCILLYRSVGVSEGVARYQIARIMYQECPPVIHPGNRICSE